MTKPKTKFIVLDGPDNAGKSTLIKDLCNRYPVLHEVKFPKTLPSGALLRINTEKDFELLFSMFDLLDHGKIYVLDRFIVSNLVYDRVLRGEDTELSTYYHKQFLSRFNVLEVFLTRPHISQDFVDDRIKLTQKQFNQVIDAYKTFGMNYQLLRRVGDEPDGVDKGIQLLLNHQIHEFMTSN